MANKNLVIENAVIRFRNFSGKEGPFNPKGNRNFCLMIDDKLANVLSDDGWNIKHLTPKDPEDDVQPYLNVSVSYGKYPPKIYLVKKNSKVLLDENTVGILDWAEIANVDIIVSPYNWNVGSKSGIKAYVKTMYVTIVQDEFEEKYSNCPDSASQILVDSGDYVD